MARSVGQTLCVLRVASVYSVFLLYAPFSSSIDSSDSSLIE